MGLLSPSSRTYLRISLDFILTRLLLLLLLLLLLFLKGLET